MPVEAKVLIVDDNERNRKILREVVLNLGHNPLFAENGHIAIDKIMSDTPDIVLLDIFMPEMDGYEVLARMKGDSALKNIPVIMITAFDDMNSVVRCIEQGADDYLVKPFNHELLKARIKGSLEKKLLNDKNRELLVKVLAQQDQIEEALAIARNVQEAMLPAEEQLKQFKNVRIDTFYRAATSIGGDFYHVFEYGDNRVAFFIADISGHGPAAALIVAALKTVIENERAHCPDPDQFINIINRTLIKVVPESYFATLFFCVADFSDNSLTYCLAGHPSPILMGEKYENPILFKTNGGPVGFIESMEFNQDKIKFSTGDKLFLYSDGLFEMRGTDEEIYGMERLADKVDSLKNKDGKTIIETLVKEVDLFWNGNSDCDDVAIIVVEFTCP